MESSDVILMLSGGRDSFLAACRLLEDEKNLHVKMVTYDNGCSYCSRNVEEVARRIIEKYGADRAEYLGVYKISSVIREFFLPYFNMTPAEQVKDFPGLTPSQFHCLVCRTSMYIYSIWLALIHDASSIAEGGRKSQGFAIELPGMAQMRYPTLTRSVGLELLLPVYDLADDWRRDNELLSRGYLCKTFEAKCLIGVPLPERLDDSVVEGVHAYYDRVMLPLIQEQDFLTVETGRRYIGNGYNELKP